MGYVVAALLVAIGLGAGVGAGFLLAPPVELAEPCDPANEGDCPNGESETAGQVEVAAPVPFDYVKLTNQFVVPVVKAERVAALVVVSLTLEVAAGSNAVVFDREPRLRDAFLQEMFDFAYTGGFDGPFTQSENLAALRRALREHAQRIAGADVHDVLIVDIVRQEM